MKYAIDLFAEIDRSDDCFEAFCRGWQALVAAVAAEERNERPNPPPSGYSMEQEAQLWGYYTGQIEWPTA
jgi:hypothetical protein